ncbi:MarR family transcriptional regulator [Alkalispirillum mobile]|uniref:MarR family transcriptional regulator n=1 Tax=Alkalispirillum mobile TaxID=85925 RepID=A0A498C3Q5_9GAMM|nr:MarR family winged helix-turn-helix transcriptional regulator [Alkalispirillum mobile]RLK50774.1 MarR family transcriptional regulator [Alkalispirillum mobile]
MSSGLQPAVVGALMRYLVRVGESNVSQDQVTPLQWIALNYFAIANTASRTVSGFAAYNATSKGTASQVVNVLERRGLVSKTRSSEDGRSTRIAVTERGARALRDHPENRLNEAIGHLPPADQAALERIVSGLLTELETDNPQLTVGTCHDCSCLEAGGDGAALYCWRKEQTLQQKDLNQICVQHEPVVGKRR